MRKILFLSGLIFIIFVLSGCSNKENKFLIKNKNTNQNNIQNVKKIEKVSKIQAITKVGYIDFKAIVMDKSSFSDIKTKNSVELKFDSTKTIIMLMINNHRDNLSVFDYKKLVKLNNKLAENWQEISSAMGGHHISGILTFAKNENPQNLIISGLPVGEVVLNFKK